MAAMVEALKAQAVPSGVRWIDALSSSVRPVLTYWWCVGLYTAAKVITVVVAWQATPQLATLAPLLLTDFDRMVVSSMVAFWFVDRALRRGNL
jgi:hypothetical protein